MIRHLKLDWPAGVRRRESDAAGLRLLAVSDEPDRALGFQRNRELIGHVDAVIGCGDLEPDYLAFLADAFCVRCSTSGAITIAAPTGRRRTSPADGDLRAARAARGSDGGRLVLARQRKTSRTRGATTWLPGARQPGSVCCRAGTAL